MAAAARVFDEAGYRDTTTNEIAAEAGVSIGSLYQYFPNKDAILAEIARRHIGTLVGAVDGLLGAQSAGTPLDTVIGTIIDLLVDQHNHDRLHLLIAHDAPRTPEIEHELRRAQDHLVTAAGRLLEKRVPDARRRRLTAQMAVAVLDAAIHHVILRQPPGPDRDAAVAMTRATVSAIVLGPASDPRR